MQSFSQSTHSARLSYSPRLVEQWIPWLLPCPRSSQKGKTGTNPPECGPGVPDYHRNHPSAITREPDDILRALKAADERLKEPEDWWQNGYVQEDGQTCLGVALMDADEDSAVCATAANYIASMLPSRLCRNALGDIFAFNDHPDTTFYTMKALLARGIKKRMAEVGVGVAG